MNNKQASGNQTAGDFFWFYFSYENNWKQCLEQPGEIPGQCLLMTALRIRCTLGATLCTTKTQYNAFTCNGIFFQIIFIKTSCQPKTKQMNASHIQLALWCVPFNKNSCLKFWKFHTPTQWYSTFQLYRPDPSQCVFGQVLVSRVQMNSSGDNNIMSICQMERVISVIPVGQSKVDHQLKGVVPFAL